MINILIIAFGAGLQDGLNPCIFMASTFLIIQGFWLTSRIGRPHRLRVIFVLTYFISALIFNFGPGQILTLNKDFIFAAKILYFFLGAGVFVLGVLFFKDWL